MHEKSKSKPSLEDLIESFMSEVIPEGELSDKEMNLVYKYLEKFVDYVKSENGVETDNKDNPVPSLELDFTPDKHPMFIKYPNDWRKTKKWEQVTNMQWMRGSDYWICKTDRFGWVKLSHCQIKQNGVETDKEQLLKEWYENKPLL